MIFFVCLYDGKQADIKLTFSELAKQIDKDKNIMTVIIEKKIEPEKKFTKSKYVICPICTKDIRIAI